MECGRGGEGQEGSREEGEESARQLEEVDQGDADASEDSKQVFGKREKVKTHLDRFTQNMFDAKTVFNAKQRILSNASHKFDRKRLCHCC